MESTSGPGLLPVLLGLLVAAAAAVFVARALRRRARRRARQRRDAPPVDATLDRATRLRTVMPPELATAPPQVAPPPPPPAVGSVAGEPVAGDPAGSAPDGDDDGAAAVVTPVSAARAAEIVGEELSRARPGERTADDIAAEAIAAEAAAHSGADAAALASLPVEALPAFGDNVVVARGAGPQLLLAATREILDGRAEAEDAEDLPDPLVRALDGGGACMSLPPGAGVETALFVLDLLARPRQGEPVYGEAWVTIRHEDVFLSVGDPEASEALETAAAEAAANFPEDDPRFGQHLTAAVSTALEARGLPYGARLFAHHAEARPGARLALTDDLGGGYLAQWDTLDEPRLRPTGAPLRAWTDVPEDAREALGL